jgi:hypothetical protein
MIISRQDVQAALEALESAADNECNFRDYERAANGLRAALAKPAQDAPPNDGPFLVSKEFEAAWKASIYGATGKGQISAAPPQRQPQGEPVAWRYQDASGHYRYRGYVPNFDKEYAILKPVPLYTTPPQRAPLTIAQINALPEAGGWWPCGLNDRIVALIRAVERTCGVEVPR